VLTYLPEAPQLIARIATRFPGALLAFDTYSQRMMDLQHQRAAKKNMAARWAWACDDPRSLESLGLELITAAAVTRPPRPLVAQWPLRYRLFLPVARRLAGDITATTLFRSRPR
jgi:O-methyltransferase involved in polyketide biosynthesis